MLLRPSKCCRWSLSLLTIAPKTQKVIPIILFPGNLPLIIVSQVATEQHHSGDAGEFTQTNKSINEVRH